MNRTQMEAGVAALVQARRTNRPLAALPDGSQPTSLADAHAMQDLAVQALQERVGGWKVAFAKDGAVMHGVIVGSRLLASPAVIAAALVPLLGIEVEIAFRFERDLPPRPEEYQTEDVAAAVSALVGIEIVATRFGSYADTPLLDRGADFMSNGAYVTGTVRPDWRRFDLPGLEATLVVNGEVVVRQTGGLAPKDPMIPTLALVNALRVGSGVKAGQIITAGTYTGMHFAKPGDVIAGEFKGFGRAEVLLDVG